MGPDDDSCTIPKSEAKQPSKYWGTVQNGLEETGMQHVSAEGQGGLAPEQWTDSLPSWPEKPAISCRCQFPRAEQRLPSRHLSAHLPLPERPWAGPGEELKTAA